MAQSMEKIKKSIDGEKKAICIDFKKGVDTYAENPQHTQKLKQVILNYSAGIAKLDNTFDLASTHIQDVSCNALGYLPKRYEIYKKTIKLGEK